MKILWIFMGRSEHSLDDSHSHIGYSEVRLISTYVDCALKCRHLSQLSYSAEHTAHQKILLQRCWTEIRMVRLISNLVQNRHFLVKKDSCLNIYVVWLVPLDGFRATTLKYVTIGNAFRITNIMIQFPTNRNIWDSVVRTFIIIPYEYWICSSKSIVPPWYSTSLTFAQ